MAQNVVYQADHTKCFKGNTFKKSFLRNLKIFIDRHG